MNPLGVLFGWTWRRMRSWWRTWPVGPDPLDSRERLPRDRFGR